MRPFGDEDRGAHDGENGAGRCGRSARAPGNGWNVRPFGAEAPHLDVDLTSGGRAQQITRVLEVCFGEPEASRWTLACRLQALLRVVLAQDDSSLTLIARCANSRCGKSMELELDVRSFVLEGCEDGFEWTPDGSTVVSLRLPNAVDQERWRVQGLEGGADDLRAMAGSLITAIDGKTPAAGFAVPAAWMNGLADAFEAHDPLTTLQVDAECPDCGERDRLPIDLEHCLLARLRAEQQRLIEDVHCLASAYHWSETSIVQLPRWRRASYLARVSRDSER